MSKQNTNLVIKLLLTLILALIICFIFEIGQTPTSIEAPIEIKMPEIQTQIEEAKVIPKLINKPIVYSNINYKVYYDATLTKKYLKQVKAGINTLKAIDKTNYTKKAIKAMNSELVRLKEIRAKMNADLTKYLKWEKEHYYAAKVWEYFRQRGYSQEVTCAIIGNMMVETSGGTLNLQPDIYSASGNYYGLCQWSRYYYPEAQGLSFEHQLSYLLDTMPDEFKTFGWLYKKDFSFEDFTKMTNIEEATLAFTKVYERCGPASYEQRQQAALVAYKYFKK